MYRSVVNRDEAIGLEKIEEFVEKVIRIVADKLEEVLDVVTIEATDTTTSLGYIIDNIAGRTPQAKDAKESSTRDTAAQKNVMDGEETALKQPDGCDLEVAADRTVHGVRNFTKSKISLFK